MNEIVKPICVTDAYGRPMWVYMGRGNGKPITTPKNLLDLPVGKESKGDAE